MKLETLPLPPYFKNHYTFDKLTPIQTKAIQAGLLDHKSLLICAPTASGKTLIGSMAIANILDHGKAIYLVPLKALASEKKKEFTSLFQNYRCSLAIGDIDSDPVQYSKDNLIIMTTEKLDSLLRHHATWIHEIKTVIIDEIHLLNDPKRGPTLEIIITLLKMLIKPQIIGLSATIGNPKELATWLEATLVQDDWRPIKLKKGIHLNQTEFY